MTNTYVTDAQGRSGRYVRTPLAPLQSAPKKPLPEFKPIIRELGDGRVSVTAKNGASLGLYANRALADNTLKFLSQ